MCIIFKEIKCSLFYSVPSPGKINTYYNASMVISQVFPILLHNVVCCISTSFWRIQIHTILYNLNYNKLVDCVVVY